MSYGSYKQSIMWVEQKTVDSNYTVNLGIERIYPLTHLQEGILYHYISKETKQYVSQDVFLINQNINSNILADVLEYSNDENDDEKMSPQSMDTTDRGSGEIVQEGKLSFELIGNGSLELIKSF